MHSQHIDVLTKHVDHDAAAWLNGAPKRFSDGFCRGGGM
jgi:hypothetical protein